MITTLHIKNIGIIDDININLNNGFNVLTGETGAGKTLIIGSLQILAGGRFSKEMIKNEEKASFVEMSIYLPDSKYEEDTVIVSREINNHGKNICKINGRLVTVNELKNFMSDIIDIHGQNDNQSILNVSTHIELLDDYSGKELDEVKEKYIKLYNEYKNIKSELEKNYGDDKEKQRKMDLLNYQITEIEDARLKNGEESELEKQRKLILSAEKISSNLDEAERSLNENTIDSINNAIKALEKIEQFNSGYTSIILRIKSCYYEIQEASSDISKLNQEIYFDEEEQTEIEERLDLIKSLKRKYGNNVEEILEYKNKVKGEIFDIQNMEEYISKLKSNLKNIEDKMQELSNKMNTIRKKYAEKLSKEINEELKDLEMKNAKFGIKIEFSDNKEFTVNGLNKIEFMISTNIGEEEKALVKIASGGEMSRIMLAIKNMLADVDKIPVLIFDEIDTGISGVAANKTGEKIKKISEKHQVICVTHLASIAAKGDYNYYVYKEIENNKTKTRLKQLTEQETLEEIARIASGNITEISIKHAKELRKYGKELIKKVS